MIININDKKCWVCGSVQNVTMHHAIPQHINPNKNITIPICRKCHDKIHYDDVTGMYSYLHKIEKTFSNSSKSINILKTMLTENTKCKQKLEKLMSKNKITLGDNKK